MISAREWQTFLKSYYDLELEEILKDPKERPHNVLFLDAALLLDYNWNLASTLFSDPKTELSLAAGAALQVQQELLDEGRVTGGASLKEPIQIRLQQLPCIPEVTSPRLPVSGDAGKFRVVNGTVIRTGSVKVLERNQLWRCSICQGNYWCFEQGNCCLDQDRVTNVVLIKTG
eukprot:sb/3472088/